MSVNSDDPDPMESSAVVDPFARFDDERKERMMRYDKVSQDPDYAEKLHRTGAAFAEKAQFQPGDLVQWKPNMKDGRLPEYTRPAVYLGEREPASRICHCGRHFEDEFDDSYFGVLDEDLDFRVFTVDSRRLMEYPPPQNT
ncbi:hypothetical protein [Enemella evansiae]|uniref:hypothetical protein n=1 Tax=Enemella evansiae TaxID=2016499 RepID=UPI00117CA69F|nr:hypothetical protein [Enemella evansiae]